MDELEPRLASRGLATASIITVVALGSIVFGLVLGGFAGEADACTLADGNCYCESPTASTSAVRQPVNTWSNLIPIVVGAWIAIAAQGGRISSRFAEPSPMAGPWFGTAYGILVVVLGLGSMAFHASLTRVGGWLDNLSMILFVLFVLVYDWARVGQFDGDHRRVAGIFGAVGLALAIGIWAVVGTGILAFSVLVAGLVAVELVISSRGIGTVKRRAFPWLLAALLTFGVATVVWRLSWTGAPLCDPGSILQGHALWHLMAEAAVPVLLFIHLSQPDRRSSLANVAS